ncbi:hypothetical protein BKA70DRAFT_1435243 [Coprinopsis sp. MPI-PUGE-AT-0042]|nr:hypothetical protein BKA70DRAFT_1435243 [Coprinopsis sp. MPI-PUGE-AT-0042]
MHYNNACQRLYGRAQPLVVKQVNNLWEAFARVDLGTGEELVELGTGVGKSIQEAKDAAASQAYEYLRVIYPNAGLPPLDQ